MNILYIQDIIYSVRDYPTTALCGGFPWKSAFAVLSIRREAEIRLCLYHKASHYNMLQNEHA